MKQSKIAIKKPIHKTVAHHAKRVWHMTPKFVHGAIAGAFVGVVVVLSLGVANQASALSFNTSRDCDDYSIIHCGAITTSELKSRYNDSGVAPVYTHFGISAANINSIDATAVAGTVYNDGRVTVNGKTVATDAITAARLNVNGSTKVTEGGATFYVRHVKVSFSHTSVPAYVVMKDGQFVYAIMAPCGNPVIATPTPLPPKPVPTPTTPVPSTPVVVQASADTTVLPNTGPGALIIIAILAIAGGYASHHTHRHIKRKRNAKVQTHGTKLSPKHR